MITTITDGMKKSLHIPYALRLVPPASFAYLLACPAVPPPGTIALASLEKIGKNARLELANSRLANLHEGDLLAVVFGNRYATHQYEGYAGTDGEYCDLLSMGGLCGLVKSKHASVAEPSKLHLVGMVADTHQQPLRLRDFSRPNIPSPARRKPHILVVCGASMDSGKTYTAMSLIMGLQKTNARVAAIKLTGTAAGRDTWSMRDAGASIALDFIDGGVPSTYRCKLEELLDLHTRLLAYATAQGVDWVVVEIADGLLQDETAALLQEPSFTETIDTWIFAAGDPLGAVAGIGMMRDWGIEPIGISGIVSMSPLGMREVQAATGLSCLTARELQRGDLNVRLEASVSGKQSSAICCELPVQVRM